MERKTYGKDTTKDAERTRRILDRSFEQTKTAIEEAGLLRPHAEKDEENGFHDGMTPSKAYLGLYFVVCSVGVVAACAIAALIRTGTQ